MKFDAREILSILDGGCDAFTFPMLDNGYVYLAATRLSLYRSSDDWALVIEVFGFSPRVGLPDTHIYTFASRLHARNTVENYVSRKAYENYLIQNPNNESRFIHPVERGIWQDPENCEIVAESAKEIVVRGMPVLLPEATDYTRNGIHLENPPRVQVFEASRYLARVARDEVLAAPAERRASVLPDMSQVLQLEEWHHPNVVDDEDRPSGSETFRQLADVLVTGNTTLYRPTLPPNTHWQNWPDGGRL
jgi:hypothetical protein